VADIHPPSQQDHHRHRQAHQQAIGIAKDRLNAVPHITSALGKSPALSNPATHANTCRFVPTTPTFANQTAQGNRPSYKMSPAVIPSIIIKRKEAKRLDPVDLDQIEALDTFSHIG
jgi:hypothetical protein